MDKREDLELLFHKYLENRCSPEELDDLMSQFGDPDFEILWNQFIEEKLRSSPQPIVDTGAESDSGALKTRLQGRLQTILSSEKKTFSSNRRFYLGWKWAAAASILIIIGLFGALFIGKNKISNDHLAKTDPIQDTIQDVMPGGNKAILTLANGAKVALDSLHGGLLTQQGGSHVVNTAGGLLKYDMAQPTSMVVYNTLSTPNGGQYRLRLQDGTMVWLNSGSSIHYPTTFTGNERLVEITGEVYFEVVHNAEKPFMVKAGNQIIKDVGTHFNVNAYKDANSIKTTLLEGSVSVHTLFNNAKTPVMLRPGQQAEGTSDGHIVVHNLDNADNEIAWQKGLFYFDNANIREVMQQLAKWYDIKVIYQGKLSQRRFKGKIQRNIPLSLVLQNIGQDNMRYKIDNNTVTIYPQ